MKNKRLVLFTKRLLDVMFWGGIAICVVLPLIIHFLQPYYPNLRVHFLPNYGLFGMAGIMGVLIIRDLRKMFRTVIAENCFVRSNVESLHDMSIFSMIIAACFICRLFLVITPATLIIILVFAIAGLFSHVLSLVFDEAIRYKEENDLTI